MVRATRKTVPRRRMAPNPNVTMSSPASSLSSLSASSTSRYATSGGGRMNTHILLAISFLVLGSSTNAQPLSVGDKADLADTFSETFLRFVNGNTAPANGQTLVLNRPGSPNLRNKQELVLNRPVTPETAAEADDEAIKTTSSSRFHIPPPPDLLFSEGLSNVPDLHLPHLPSLPDILPEIDIQGATLAMGIAKVLQGMRGIFVEVAKDEADVLVGEVLRLENGGREEGFLLEGAEVDDVNHPLVELVEVLEMSDSELATVDSEELAIPGAFDPQVSLPEAPPSSGASLEATGARIDPYAALAISATLSSLVVVLVIIGRHMVLQARERKAYEEDLEAQDADAKLLDEEEVNEKVGLVDPARGNILVDVGIVEENEKEDEEMRKAREALYLLVEVANAAAPTSSGSSSRPITPTPVHIPRQDLVISTSRPGSPVPQSDSRCTTPLRDAVEKLRSAAGTPTPGGRVSLCVPRQYYGPHKEGSDDTDDSDEEHSRIWRSANTSPVPPFMSSPSTNGSSEDDEDFVDAPELAVIPTHVIDNEVKAKRPPLPSAELTYAALDLALQLPGTEWIFQFLVIFVSWFGMFLGPTTTRRGR